MDSDHSLLSVPSQPLIESKAFDEISLWAGWLSWEEGENPRRAPRGVGQSTANSEQWKLIEHMPEMKWKTRLTAHGSRRTQQAAGAGAGSQVINDCRWQACRIGPIPGDIRESNPEPGKRQPRERWQFLHFSDPFGTQRAFIWLVRRASKAGQIF